MSTRLVWVAAAIWGFAGVAAADVITFSGTITQSTQDGTGPAANNPGLNLIADGDPFTVTLSFAGAIGSPGTYPLTLTRPGMFFLDPAAPVIETLFVSATLTVSPDLNPFYDDISLLGCLSSGSGCDFGNQLDANFEIPATSLTSQNIVAIGLDQPHPLDLLEDDGATDIHGTITGYSYSPEPSSAVLLLFVLAAVLGSNRALATRRGSKS